MKITLTGIGLWARGMASLADFVAASRDGFTALNEARFEPPKPNAIPSRERRRAGLAINLGVEVAHQACDVAGIDKSTVPSVFVSALGDTAITDYMCRKLTGADKLLSPTKFHNSVHNAPACYWAISANNRAPNTFLGGFLESLGVGFLEASSQAIGADAPALLVAYDIATEPPLDDVAAITDTLALAFVIEPSQRARLRQRSLAVDAELRFVGGAAPPPVPRAAALARLSAANPMGGGLALVERCVSGFADGGQGDEDVLRFPAASQAHIELRLESIR